MQHQAFNLNTLKNGTERQQAAYGAIVRSGVMQALRPYTPVLAGTIPLDVDIPDSDLDILCYAPDLDAFAAEAEQQYGHIPTFNAQTKPINGHATYLVRFQAFDFDFELFAQAIPVEQQNGYVHMLIEHRLLALFPQSREPIRNLKRSGLKTEPAFAHHFKLIGDPYAVLLQLARLDDADLLRRFTT